MSVGRPTKYSEEILQKLSDYIDRSIANPKALPTKEQFAGSIHVNTDTIQEWMSVHREFSVALKDLEDLQKQRLITLGLMQVYNPTMSIFLLKANHGMIETERKMLVGKDGKDLPTPILHGIHIDDSSTKTEQA